MSREVEWWRWGQPVAPLRRRLERGGVLAIPTESSYGLAADPRSLAGVEAIFAIKGRPPGRPLPVVVADLAQIRALGGAVDELRRSGLATLWPGPLTLLLPLRWELPAAAGSDRCGFRIPAHRPLRRLLRELGHGLTATSANRSGEPPILDPAELPSLLVRSGATICDGGRAPGGPPSTVAVVRDGRVEIVRPGALSAAELESAWAGAPDESED